MSEVTRTSTPRNNKLFGDCRIELSPIQNAMPSTKVLPCFSEHADSREKYSASKINGQSEDSDYEDNKLKESRKMQTLVKLLPETTVMIQPPMMIYH